MSIVTVRNRMRDAELTAIDYSFTESNLNGDVNNMAVNGSWPDVAYLDQPQVHASRLRRMARAYWTPSHSRYLSPLLKDKIILGCTYIDGATVFSSNWYDLYISLNTSLARCLLMMDSGTADGLTRLQLQDFSSSKCYYYNDVIAAVASNTVDSTNQMGFLWAAIMKGVVNDDSSRFNYEYGLYYSNFEGKNFVQDGVNLDMGFRFHAMIPHWTGSYGSVWLSTSAEVLPSAFGTEWQSIPAVDFYIDAHIQGFLWCTHKRIPELNHMGRELGDNGNYYFLLDEGDFPITFSLNRFTSLSYRTSDFNYIKSIADGTGTLPAGSKYMWMSHALIRKTSNSHIGIMFPTRRLEVVSESFSGEGITHMWLRFGSYFALTDASEMFEIQPVWTWSRIPGATTLDYMPTFEGLLYAQTDFGGGVNNGQFGVVGYKHNWKQVSANKFYFITPEGIFCMGNNLVSTNATHQMITTLQQNISSTVATIKRTTESTVEATEVTHSDIQWVFNGKAAYHFPNGGNVSIKNQNQSGSWSIVDSNRSSSTITKKIFTARLNHGINTSNQSYQYNIVQDTTLEATRTYVNPYVVLKNDATAQAVRYANDNYGIVFYGTGSINLEVGVTISSKNPCIILINFPIGSRNSATISLSDPLGFYEFFEFDISLNLVNEYSIAGVFNSSFKVPTPKQDYACSCVQLICT